MKYIDLHADTLLRAYKDEVRDLDSFEGAMVDIARLKEAKCIGQFFAIFMREKEKMTISDDDYINLLAEILKENIDLTRDYDSLISNIEKEVISAFLTLEDGRSVEASFEKLGGYYDLGIRLITLTWNSPNCFGYPNSFDSNLMEKGLTSFGKEAIEYMNEKGIIIDVSHLSDGGFYDVLEISKKPFMASHSNARQLSPHPRNMTDPMIKALADSGGLMGLNFCPAFLNKDISCRESRVKEMLAHVKHISNVGGMDIIALGTDFDGISGNFEIDSPLKLNLLFDALLKEGFSSSDLEKFAYKNALRVLKETL